MGVAVNVTFVPEQIVVAEADIETEGTEAALTVATAGTLELIQSGSCISQS